MSVAIFPIDLPDSVHLSDTMRLHTPRIFPVVVSALVLLSGCIASPKLNYRPVGLDVSEPPIGSISTKGVGEEMLKQGKFFMLDVLKVNEPVKVGLGHYVIEPGIFAFIGSDETSNYYKVGGLGSESGTVTRGIGQEYVSVMLKRNSKELCVTTVHSTYACGTSSDTRYSLIQRPTVFENSIQQTLIYNGKVGNKISIGYREFSNNVARPAFSNNVDYDLGESKVIGYRGAEIEILEATNRHIKFRLIKNFNVEPSSFPIDQPAPAKSQVNI